MDKKELRMAEQKDDKLKIARLERKIENLEAGKECARMDMENYKISFGIQNEVIDGLNFVIKGLEKRLEKAQSRTVVTH